MSNSNNSFYDWLNVVSVMLGLQNLQENREQSEHNDIQIANANQAKFILAELSRQFEKLEVILSEQSEMLQEILKHLKGFQNE